MEEEYALTHKDLRADVFLGFGEEEVTATGASAIASSTSRMIEMLSSRKYPSLHLHARVFAGEDHLTVIPLNLEWGLRTLWEDGTSRTEARQASK
jgi:hypothetical protein